MEEVLERLTVTIAEAAKMVGIGDKAMREIVRKDSSFPAFKNRSCTLIPREGLKAWVEERGKLRWGLKTSGSETAALIDEMRKQRGRGREKKGIA